MTRPIKVLFVDWNKTLSDSLFWGHLKTQNPTALSVIEEWLFKKNPQIVSKWMRGGISAQKIVAEMAIDTELDEEFLGESLQKSCRAMQLKSSDCFEIVARIRAKGIKVVIATDNMDVFNTYTVPALRLNEKFDGILNSYNLGCLKTDADKNGGLRFFRDWLHDHSIDIREAVLIDDSIQHKAFFESYGLKFLGVDAENEAITHLYQYAS